ncbi:hypothetical protein C0989_006281 [Termitomyces sp. Mn162]|nr:hypothetical protein C0989_006281 [Termitomyces sp. Mn162]
MPPTTLSRAKQAQTDAAPPSTRLPAARTRSASHHSSPPFLIAHRPSPARQSIQSPTGAFGLRRLPAPTPSSATPSASRSPGAQRSLPSFSASIIPTPSQNGTGTRLIPDGAITGAHFVQTPDFVQVTGVGNLTFVNVPAGDQGGELDPHGQDGNGNPIGGLVFSSAFGQLEEIFEWTNFVSDSQFCFRACKPAPMAPTWCQHIYDTMGCNWNMPANYDAGVFEQCMGDSGQPMGVYGTSTFFQGEPSTPPAHPIPPSSECTPISTIANGIVAITTSASLTVSLFFHW